MANDSLKVEDDPMRLKVALYFGFGSGGHFLRGLPRTSIDPQRDCPGFPWTARHLDGGLLNNAGIADSPDGRVYWVWGGDPPWFAFYWWDRSGDDRGGSNSGFYVRGFSFAQRVLAFQFACARWPDVVKRQTFPLVLAP